MNNFSLSSMMCMCHKLARGSRYLEDVYYTLLSSCCTLPLEGEQLRHPAQQWAGWAAKAELASTLLWKVFLPCSLVLCFWLLCKYCWVLLRWELVSSRMQRLGTASLQGKPSVHATSYTMMVQSMKHIICSCRSVKKEATELGMLWKGHLSLQCAHIRMQHFTVRPSPPTSSCFQDVPSAAWNIAKPASCFSLPAPLLVFQAKPRERESSQGTFT